MSDTAKIIPIAPPPNEFPLYFHEGIVSTEYGNILITDVNLKATLDLFAKRGRSIYGDFDHQSSVEGSPDEKISPFHIGKLAVRSGMLYAEGVQWTESGSKSVSDGSYFYTSIELRDSTKLQWDEKANYWTITGPLDIKSVALTRDPAVHGATPIRPDVRFSASGGKVKPKQWRFSMPVEEQKKDPPVKEPPMKDSAEAPEPQGGEAESKESGNLDAINQMIDAAMAASNDPEEVKKYLTNLKSIVASMVDSQKKEIAQAPAQASVPEAEDPKKEMSAEDKEAKTAYSILTKHFGKLSPAKLEARLFSLSQAKKSLTSTKQDLSAQEEDQKKSLLKLSIERTLLSPHDADGQKQFLSMSLAACKEFADAEGIKHQFSIPDMARLTAPMPKPETSKNSRSETLDKLKHFSAEPVRTKGGK